MYYCLKYKISFMEELKNKYLTLCNEVDYPISDEHMYKNIISRSRLKKEHIEILNCIKIGDIDKLVELHEFNYIGYYKELPIRLAIKYEQLDILDYLVKNKYLNRKLDDIIGKLVISPIFFDKLYNKYHDVNYEYPKTLSLREWYRQVYYLEINELFLCSIRGKNKKLIHHIKRNYKLDDVIMI